MLSLDVTDDQRTRDGHGKDPRVCSGHVAKDVSVLPDEMTICQIAQKCIDICGGSVTINATLLGAERMPCPQNAECGLSTQFSRR